MGSYIQIGLATTNTRYSYTIIKWPPPILVTHTQLFIGHNQYSLPIAEVLIGHNQLRDTSIQAQTEDWPRATH